MTGSISPTNMFRLLIILWFMGIASCTKPSDDTATPVNQAAKGLGGYLYASVYDDTTISQIPMVGSGHQGNLVLTSYDTISTRNALTGLDSLQLKTWERRFPTVGSTYRLYAAKGLLMVSTYQSFQALDLKTGQTKWKREDNSGFYVQMSNRNDTLYYTHATNHATLEAVNIRTGESYWQQDIGPSNGLTGNALVTDDTCYFTIGSSPCVHYTAFNLVARKSVWLSDCISGGNGSARSNNNIFLGGADPSGNKLTTLVCIDALTGAIKWTKQKISDWRLISDPSGREIIMVTSALDFAVWGIGTLDPESGNILWRTEPGGILMSFAFGNNRVYIGKTDFTYTKMMVQCFNYNSGELVWTHVLATNNYLPALGKVDQLMIQGDLLIANYKTPVGGLSWNCRQFHLNALTGQTIDSTLINNARFMPYFNAESDLYLVSDSGTIVTQPFSLTKRSSF